MKEEEGGKARCYLSGDWRILFFKTCTLQTHLPSEEACSVLRCLAGGSP